MMQRIILLLSCAAATAAISAQNTAAADSLVKELREVVATAHQPATKLEGTTLVTSIAGSTLQEIGTALDVLAQLPMINVADDAVTIIGKGSPEIIIDGRPMHSNDELIMLQSRNIKKVELMMAPGAMYANDTRAVLKITTRRNFVSGLSLLERAEGVVRRKLSANNLIDLNYRTGTWDFFLSGLIARNNNCITGITTNSLSYCGQPTVIGSSQRKSYPSTVGVVKGGFNHASATRSFGGYYRFNPERGDFSNHGAEWYDDNPEVRLDIDRMNTAHSHRFSAYYDDTFSGHYHLHIDSDYKNSRSVNTTATTYPEGTAEDVNSADTRNSSIWAGKAYLTFPSGEGIFTIGTQDSYTRTTLDYRMLNPQVSEYIPSSLSEARQISAATFASWTREFGHLSLSAGLRYEYVDYRFDVNATRDNDVSHHAHLLTPDISVGYSFDDVTHLSLSYKMATVKPPYSQLTGSLSYVGMHQIEGGNPALNDEKMHDIQLFGSWKGLMLQADFTRSIDTYAFIKRIYQAPTLQLLLQPVNIDVSAIDIYLIWNRPVKAWIPSLTIGMHKQWLALDTRHYNRPILSYNFDNTITLPNDFTLTLNASGRTEGDMHTNRFGSTWLTLTASLSKSFLNKSLQLKLAGTDLLDSRNDNWMMTTYGITVDKRQSYDRRGVSLTVTYRFQPRKSKYKGNDASKSEMNRL